jgi:DNA polymerase
MDNSNIERARSILIARLESLQQAGVLQLPRPKSKGDNCLASNAELAEQPALKSAPAVPTVVPTGSDASSNSKQTPAPRRGQRPANVGWQPLGAGSLFGPSDGTAVTISTAPTLQVLQQEVAGCTRCEELARTRTQTVFGVGNPHARLCFAGEAPGADEDRIGEPFVGRAGQLLTKIIEACRTNREDVYILNMIKCRPPGNRNPLPEELSNCRSYLERQLALVRPEFICCLGAVAAQNLLETTLSIGKLRGKVHMHRGAKIVCTYHPAYLLRNPAAKKDTWEDMKLLMREMGVEL